MFKAKARPESLTQTHGPTNLPTSPMRPLDQSRTTVQSRILLQFPTTTVCVQNQPAQRNYVTCYGHTVRPPNRLIKEM